MRDKTLRRWFSLGALPLLWCALMALWAFYFTGHFPSFLDVTTYVFPEKWVNTSQWLSGTVPLWNPWISCGTPHLAQIQPGCFYPPFFLWLFTGLNDWFFYLSFLHSLWAMLGFFLWVRGRGVSWTLAWLGAGSFAFGGLAVSNWGFVTHVATMSWIPWVFFAAEVALRRGTLAAWSGLALTLTMQTLAGYVFFGFYTYLALVAYLLWGRTTTRGQWKAFTLASSGAVLLSAVQILPFLDYLTYAQRLMGGYFVFQPREWWTLLWPDVLGTPGLGSHRGVPGHFIFYPYFGLVPLLGLLLALWRWSPQTRFFAWGSVVTFLLMAGLPWAPVVLEPLKSAPVFVFLAVSGAVLYWTQDAATRGWSRKLLLVGAVLWAVDLFLLPYRLITLVPDPYRKEENLRSVATIRHSVGEGRLLSTRPRDQFYPPGLEGSLEGSVDYRVKWMLPNTNAVWGLRSAGGYLSSSVDGFQNMYRYLWNGIGNERFLDAAGVGTLMGVAPKYPKYVVQQTLSESPLTRNAGALPTVWRASFVREFPDRPAVLAALMDPSAFVEQEVFTEKSPSGGAVRLVPPRRTLHGDTGESFGWLEQLRSRWGRFWGLGNRVNPVRLSPCREDITADFQEQGWMVWNESYAPGWRAWVDGTPQSIFRAYGWFMAVPLKGKGLHRVTFRYEPVAFRLGLFLSLVTWATLLGWVTVTIRRRMIKGRWGLSQG
jgi:hypothetical protein